MTSNYEEIQPGTIFTWKKSENDIQTTFQIQIDINDKDENEEIYLIRTGYLYDYNELNFLTYLKDYCVPISKDDFNHPLSENLVDSPADTVETEYALLPLLTLKKVYSKELVQKYSTLKEGNIVISNQSPFDEFIHVRIRVRTLGSDDFFMIKKRNSRLWRRTPGKYLVEILNSYYESKRFYVETGEEYIFTKDRLLYNNKKACYAELLSPMELFNHVTYITILDKNLGGFCRMDIIYENNSKYELKNKNYPTPFYNDQKSGYIKGQKFVDKYFSPNNNQILAINNENGQYVKPHFMHLPPSPIDIRKCDWLRPYDLFGKPYKLFQDEIECRDVSQGSLGNCYLISIIAALSERHDLIKKIFNTKVVNEDGYYEINYYEQDGTKRIMFIDDYFPLVDMGTGRQEFLGTCPNGQEIWVMLLEKAYAKYEGGWVNLEAGTITSELKFFTGCNCKELSLTSATAWEEILNACRRDNIVCCRSKKGSGSHDNKSIKNIANSHAYSILEAEEKMGVKLLKIRNPWGAVEWTGDYSDNSPLWTDVLKSEFPGFLSLGEDGVFCMAFGDFCSEFTNIVICYC